MSKNNFKGKIRNAKSFARRSPTKSPYETILIVCEGEKTECNYFHDLCKFYRLNTANIIIVNGQGSAPINVVNYAIEHAEKTPDIDHVMCVFDCDEHSTFNHAINKLQQHKPKRTAKSKPQYYAITSTPCFEIWFLLHFMYSSKPFHKTNDKSAGDNVISELKKYWPDYTKNKVALFYSLNEKQETAIKNAKKLENENKKMNSDNPSTNVHDLVEKLMKLKSYSG